MARLFEDCGWTQEMIASKMGKTQQWVNYRLTFRRFISFTTGRCNPSLPPHFLPQLTEWRFRKDGWQPSRAGKHKKETEPERLARVLKILLAMPPRIAPEPRSPAR
jgi:hypothetical protein